MYIKTPSIQVRAGEAITPDGNMVHWFKCDELGDPTTGVFASGLGISDTVGSAKILADGSWAPASYPEGSLPLGAISQQGLVVTDEALSAGAWADFGINDFMVVLAGRYLDTTGVGACDMHIGGVSSGAYLMLNDNGTIGAKLSDGTNVVQVTTPPAAPTIGKDYVWIFRKTGAAGSGTFSYDRYDVSDGSVASATPVTLPAGMGAITPGAFGLLLGFGMYTLQCWSYPNGLPANALDVAVWAGYEATQNSKVAAPFA